MEPGINCSLDEIAQSDAICIIGAHIRANQPLLQTRIRQASLNGAQVLLLIQRILVQLGSKTRFT